MSKEYSSMEEWNKAEEVIKRLKNRELTCEDILKNADKYEIFSLLSEFGKRYAGLMKRSPKKRESIIRYQKENYLEGVPVLLDREIKTVLDIMIREDAKYDGPFYVGSNSTFKDEKEGEVIA